MLVDCIRAFVESMEERRTRNGLVKIAESTKRGHLVAMKRLLEFVRLNGMDDAELRVFDEKFYKGYVAYLQGRGYCANTVSQYVGSVVAMVHWLDREVSGMCDITRWGRGKCEVDAIYLTEEVLERLAECRFEEAKMEETRDWFVAQAYMGCRFSDLWRLREVGASELRRGRLCYRQRKTLRKVVVPLHPMVLRVMERRGWRMPSLPSLATYNRRLKRMARLAGLDAPVHLTVVAGGRARDVVRHEWELVTSHTARRSFASNMYKRGVPSRVIMAVTGHRTEASFMRYIRLTEEEQAECLRGYW